MERLLLEKGCDPSALDPSENAIERLRTTFGLGERAKVGRAENLPFDDAVFDVVVMSEVLEHLDPDEFQLAIAEVGRVLRRGGRFVGTVPADEDLPQNVVACPKCGAVFHRWGHTRSFSREGLLAALSQRFSHVRVRRRFFADFADLNWKGKISCTVKRVLSYTGIRGTNENFYFEASAE